MNRKVQCMECSTTEEPIFFESMSEYLAHRDGGHVSRPIATVAEPPKAAKPVTPSATELKEMALKAQQEEVKLPEPPALPVKKPIALIYKYEGVCPTCGREVDTITVSGNGRDTLVAYCINDKKQLAQVKVIPIGDQTEAKK